MLLRFFILLSPIDSALLWMHRNNANISILSSECVKLQTTNSEQHLSFLQASRVSLSLLRIKTSLCYMFTCIALQQ